MIGPGSVGKVLILFVAAIVCAGACGQTATAPTGPGTGGQTVYPPVANASPVIRSLATSADRAEVGEPLDVTADVIDAETPAGQLEFVWSANVGTFEGQGAHVTWQVAPGTETPVDATIALEVIERYADVSAAGTPIVSEHRVVRVAPPVRVHDSNREIARMALAFLVDYFGRSTVSPDACVVDFSDTCPGKAEELSDIENNRATFVILDASARVDSIVFNSGRTRAGIVAPCTFHDRRLDTGVVGTTDGDCLLSAVYEDRRWWLCDSHFRAR